jgi:uncharacterized protein YprB with RNaseH-like and TPR domain
MSLEELTGGKVRKYKKGEFLLVEKELKELGKEGEILLNHINSVDVNFLSNQFSLSKKEREKNFFFFDIETYGRATSKPIISISFAEGFPFGKISCAFARDFSEEKQVIEYFYNAIPSSSYVLTYNGGFDLSRSSSRALANGIIFKNHSHGDIKSLVNSKHFDLYYGLAKPAWGGDTTDLKLSSIEKLKLDLFREGDLSGARIPSAYHEYVYGRKRDTFSTDPGSGKKKRIRGKEVPQEFSEKKMGELIRHNLLDVASLAGILGKYCSEETAKL